ncbi:MAG: TonB-dependent receptor [Acidobacteria bacterium]|nr:TonB-dependent receptor [Acidobacteriota bacterium]
MRKLILFRLALVVILLGSTSATDAQTINGTITGTVVDQQGAAISGATVTARNPQTGFVRSATTSSNGIFRISAVPVGDYIVTASAAGFGTGTNDLVSVSSGTDTDIRFGLTPGDVAVTVEVTASTELLDTTQSQVSKTVSSQQIVSLPGRNTLTGLALLNPGVLPNQNGRPGSGFAVNGNRTRSNNFTIDGANNNDQSLSIPRQNLPPDAIREFQIVTNTFAAEYGRNAGSYVNQITQSGTNSFHGSGFWVWGGNGLDALTTSQERSFNANAATLGDKRALRNARSVVVDNTYGFTLGGPIKKDHTFFFTSLDFNDFRTTVSSAARVAISPIGLQRLQLPGRPNLVPEAVSFLQSTFPVANDPTAQGQLNLTGSAVGFPCDPQTPGSCDVNIIPLQVFNRARDGGIPFGTDFGRWLMKVDTRLTKNDQLSFRYLVDKSTNPGSPASIPGTEIGSNLRNDSFTINDAYILSPRWLNEARFTYSRRDAQFPENLPFSFSVGGTSAFTIGNANFPQFRQDDVYEFTDNVSFTPANHSLKFGYNLLIYKLSSFFAPNSRGTVSYGSLANFLADTNASFSQYAGDGLTDATTYEHSLFAQDNWRVNPDLTLNLGLRYEYVTTPFGFFSNAKPDINNFAPRIGFAWNPKDWFGGKMVLRGGFAISYDQVFQNILLNNSRNFPRGVNVAFTNVSGQRPFINLPQPPSPGDFNGDPLLLPVRLYSPNKRISQPMSQQWTLGVQYQFWGDYVFKAEYIGTRGSNLVREIESNYGFTVASGGTGQRLDPTRGSILIGDGYASSIYHSGQFTLERRFSDFKAFGTRLGGLLFNANYTYSAFISESDDILGGQPNRTLPQDPRNPGGDRGRSAFDQPHRFVMNFVYQAPDFFRNNSVLNRIFGGWELAMIGNHASGTPFTIFNANNALGILPGQISTVEGSQRVSVNPAGQYPLVSTPTNPNPNAYFIVNAANSGIVGNLGANTERTGRTNRWDASVIKTIRTFGETQRLQLRAEIFNITNTRNFTVIPANTIGNTVNTTTFLNFGFTNVGGRNFLFGASYRF